jgi:hypothetical protein
LFKCFLWAIFINCILIFSFLYIFDFFSSKFLKNIQINASNRSNFHFYNPLDVILIEILDSDNISKDRFLYPDLNYKKGISLYVNKSFKIAGFEKNNNSIKKFIR